MTPREQKLSAIEKLAYGLGDCGANFVFQMQITFLPFFYTDVFGIAAGTAAKILLVSRMFDTFNDPIIGAIADRTSSRWGKYRPWILWTAVPLAVTLILCYTAPDLSPTGKVIWAAATYNLMMIFYAANNIPYCALSGVMTDDAIERTSLASWRFTCAMAAAFVVNAFTIKLVQHLGQGNTAAGYQAAMAVWGGMAVVCFVIAFAFTRERVSPGVRQPTSVRQDLWDLCRTGPWIALFALAVLIHIQLAFRSGSMLYYFTHYLRRQELFGWFSGIGLAVTMIGVTISKPLAAQFGKRTTFQTCLLVSSVLMAGFAVIPRDAVWALFALQIALQLAFGPTIPLLWTMMADVADYSEWRTGRRSTALAFSSIIFGLKLGLGIGAWLSEEWLAYMGYLPVSIQSEGAIRGIVMIVSLFPAAALLLGLIVLYVYPINDRLERHIRDELLARRVAERSA